MNVNVSLNIEDIGEYLKSHNIKPSYQRIKIYEYLHQNRTHPTVDEIYQVLVKDIPTLSKTTVYNTLNLFVQESIASLLTIEENETRYDANTGIHGHFKCVKCEQVTDFDADISSISTSVLDHYEVHEQHLYFKGICASCRKLKN